MPDGINSLSGSTAPVTMTPYAGTPGPGPAPSPWKQKGATVFYDEGGVNIPENVPGGSQGRGTINAEGIYENGFPINSLGGPPTGPAGGDLDGSYPVPTIKTDVHLPGNPTVDTPAPTSDGTRVPTTEWTNDAIAAAVAGLPPFPTSLPPSGPAGGDLDGTYPNPTLAAGVIPAALPPNGPAGGDLAGTYPDPTIKPNIILDAPTLVAAPPPTDNDLSIPTTSWVQALLAAGASIAVGILPPVSPVPNMLWWNSDAVVNGGGNLYIWYNDGTTTQWVPASPTAPQVPISKDDVLVYMPTDVGLNATTQNLCNTGPIGAAGQKWEVGGTALIGNNQDAATIMGVSIHDGTTSIASGGGVNGFINTNWPLPAECRAQVTLTGPTTFTLRGTGNALGANAYANGNGGPPAGRATYIWARRLS